MTKEESIEWLDNLLSDIRQTQYQALWSCEQAITAISQMKASIPDIETIQQHMYEKTEIKDKLLNIFQKNYCIICGSQECAGDLRDGCSYYRSYIDKIKEVYDDMKGEVEWKNI